MIKLAPGTYTDPNTFNVNNDVTIDVRGATLKGTGGNSIFSINGSPNAINATIFSDKSGKIQNDGNNSDSIVCGGPATLTMVGVVIDMSDKSAINMSGTCKLTISDSTISSSGAKDPPVAAIVDNGASATVSRSVFSLNRGGGTLINTGTFAIVGNAFTNNGGDKSVIGGVSLQTSSDDNTNRLEFNTIANNQIAMTAICAGVFCQTPDFTARNNIIWGNMDSNGSQVVGCQHTYSDIQQSLIGSLAGENNINSNPLFNPDFSVMVGSPVSKAADPMSDLTGIAAIDLAGKPRVKTADIGAYNVPAP